MRHVDERLQERALPIEAERAYALVRNATALRGFIQHFVTSQAISTEAERLALPLAPGDTRSLLIVTRDGAPVTCLASGMVTDLPLLPYREVDGFLIAQEEALRRNMVAARLRENDEQRTTLSRVIRYAYKLTRAEFEILATLAPLLVEYAERLLPELTRTLQKAATARQPLDVRRADHRSIAEAVWQGYSSGQVLLMAVMHHRRATRLALPLLLLMDPHLAMRAWWILLNFPRRSLDEIDQACSDGDRVGIVCGGLAAGGIAMRFPSLREEARGLLRRCMETSRGFLETSDEVLGIPLSRIDGHARRHAVFVHYVSKVFEPMISPDARAAAARFDRYEIEQIAQDENLDLLGVARRLHPEIEDLVRRWAPLDHFEAEPRTQLLPEASVSKGQRLSTELWAVALWSLDAPLRPSLMHLAATLTGAPIEAVVPHPRVQWRLHEGMEYVGRVLPGILKTRSKSEPVRNERTPGPNEPCTCGSGRKFKKCCGSKVNA